MIRICVSVLVAVVTLTTLLVTSEDGETVVDLTLEVQACRTDDFHVSFDEEARERFKRCDHPLADYEFAIVSGSRKVGVVFLDANGSGVIESVKLPVNAPVMLSICLEKRCFKLRGYAAGKKPLFSGRHFLFYEDGRNRLDD